MAGASTETTWDRCDAGVGELTATTLEATSIHWTLRGNPASRTLPAPMTADEPRRSRYLMQSGNPDLSC